MREIRTEIVLDTPPETVWELLTDLDSYGEWNPHVTRASGDLREGATLEITVERIGETPRTMTVRVTQFDPPRRLQWVGTVGSRWLFRGRHTFELRAMDGDRTRFVNREEVSGLLARFAVSEAPERDYGRMNRALQARVRERIEGGIRGRPDPDRDA